MSHIFDLFGIFYNLTDSMDEYFLPPRLLPIEELDDSNSSANHTIVEAVAPRGISVETIATSVLYILICIAGLAGNGLAGFVVLRYASMKTVTNLYILNLAIADGIFLLDVPMMVVTNLLKRWIFGAVMCKAYFAAYGISMFTGTFTLTVMSGDRYLAVCHPARATGLRTVRNARIAIAVLWAISTILFVPILIFATIVPHQNRMDYYTCTVDWPTDYELPATRAYISYTMIIGFLLPVAIICILYTLLVATLRQSSGGEVAKNNSAFRQRQLHQPRVTRLVTTIVVVFIVCWFPYWAFQIHLLTDTTALQSSLPVWKVYAYHVFTILSYVNSMINPILYAFTNQNFKDSFIGACHCVDDPIRVSIGGGGRNGARSNGLAHEMVHLNVPGAEDVSRSNSNGQACHSLLVKSNSDVVTLRDTESFYVNNVA